MVRRLLNSVIRGNMVLNKLVLSHKMSRSITQKPLGNKTGTKPLTMTKPQIKRLAVVIIMLAALLLIRKEGQ